MTSKLFKTIFLTSFSLLVIAFAVAFAIFCHHNGDFSGEVFSGVMIPMAALIAVMLPVSYLIARSLAANIARPINEAELEEIADSEIYTELRPHAEKIMLQNYRMSRQLSELKMRENEFNLMTHNMSEGLILLNSRGAVLSANRSAKRIFGITAELPDRVFGISRKDGFRAAVTDALSGKAGHYSFHSGDKYYHMTANPIFHEGRIEGVVIVAIDETEKEEREELRREFTSNVSHELKTPLTSISGFAELISSGMAEGEDAKRFAGNIHKEAKRLLSLVVDIIRLTQLDGGEIPYDGEIDLHSVAAEVAERLAGIADAAGVSLTLSGESVAVLGNFTILGEMIFNLTDNAIKYNRRGGFVRVHTERASGAAVISVSDNGIGIPKDKQDRVFERFYRVDKSHSKDIGGTGLGLSIVKHAAAYHKAKVELESTEGVGTTVRIIFPSSPV